MTSRTYYSSSSTRSASTQKQAKPTLSKPRTSNDCNIIMKRIDDDNVKLNETIKQNDTKITELTSQLAKIQKEIESLQFNSNSINTQINQNLVNKSYLEKWIEELKTVEKQNQYFNRALDFIKTYTWSDPNDDEDEDENTENCENTENVDKDLPTDMFDYLKLQFHPIDSYTSDEIIKIAHYLKACELVKPEGDAQTYFELLNSNYNYEYEVYIIGDIEHCDGTSINDYDDHDDVCCHKRYAYVITKFKDITLDDTSILNYTRVN